MEKCQQYLLKGWCLKDYELTDKGDAILTFNKLQDENAPGTFKKRISEEEFKELIAHIQNIGKWETYKELNSELGL